MATNKNQHFVPRCHLRPFTLNGNDAAINILNLDRKRLIPKAPVKNQCSRDYFYGTDDKLENAIRSIESAYGKSLREVIANNQLLNTANKNVFKTFWIFQFLRTESAAIRAVQIADQTRELAGIPPGEFALSIKEAVQAGCRAFASAMHALEDLKFCLIKNQTPVPFITSDNPAILTNKWRLDNDKTPGMSFGIGSAGMLALLPLTPNLMFVGYDGDVYSIPHENGIVKIRNPRDAIAINRHQFLQCVANVYVRDSAHAEVLLNHFSDIEHVRPAVRHVIHYAQLDGTTGDHDRYVVINHEHRDPSKEAMLHSQIIYPHPLIWPSQIRIRNNGAVYTNDSGVGYVRYSGIDQWARRPFRRERP